MGPWEQGQGMSGSTQASASSAAPAIVGAVGTLLVLAAAGAVAMQSGVLSEGGSSSSPKIYTVDQRDINDAAGTLAQSVAGGLVDDAKRCRVPLAVLTIAKGTSQVGSNFRVRSGSYVSPYFTVADGIQRIALPYPSPYGQGSGTLVIEGNATGAVLGLNPTKTLNNLPEPQSIQVTWRAVSPC
jgi:hypothetical protein